MAVGPLNTGFPSVAVHCEVCNVDLLVWPCYSCGGQYCGRCIFLHADVPGVNLYDYDNDLVDPNEVAEGMHFQWRRLFERWGMLAAADSAYAAVRAGLLFRCRG